MKSFFLTLIATAIAFSPHPTQAADEAMGKIGFGRFDFEDNTFAATELRLEYAGKNVWKSAFPITGVNINSDGGTYAFAGLGYDFKPLNNFYITPSFAAGLWKESSSKDLGGPVEFRSQLELGYETSDKYRVGISYSHMSNAKLYEHNPGEESIIMNFSIPLSKILKK